jgi:hypothetical protein
MPGTFVLPLLHSLKYETGGPSNVFLFRVALCTGVATAKINKHVLSHVSKTSRSEVGPGVVRWVQTLKLVLASTEHLKPC